MSIAVSSTVPFFGTSAATRLSRRIAAISTMHLAGLVLVALVGGILASILTTTDPLWWQLHFSQLGTFHDVSAGFFNGSLKVGGMLVVVFAIRVRRDLVRLGRTAARRGAATVVQLCLTTIGVNLALVGCIPLNSNKDLHDKVAGMMVLGFAALLLSSPVLLHRMPKRLVLTTSISFVVIFAGAWLFVTETINLTLFEVIAFTVMFAWSGVFTRCLAMRSAQLAPVSIPDAETSAPRPTTSVAIAPVLLPALSPATPLPVIDLRAIRLAHDAALVGAPLPLGSLNPAAWLTTPASATGLSACVAPVGSGARRRPSRAPSTAHPRALRGPSMSTGAARGARALPRRGCTASAARATSGTWTTPDHR